MPLLEKYKKYFPEITSLYSYQLEAFDKLKNNKNILAIFPTGGGKSLIFQLFALDLTGITIVISPLLALMSEQVNELNKRGIKAVALNSDITFDQQRELLRNIGKSNIKLLYVAPERLQNSIFRASLAASGANISLIVIDEAHCISQWGQGFRPDYSQIKPFIVFLNNLNNNPIVLALTATLAKKPREEILKEFLIKKDDVIVSENILRKNLKLHFKEVVNEEEKEKEFESFLNIYKPKKTVVYLFSKRKCEDYSVIFRKKGYKTNFFHSGIDNKEDKDKIYDLFLNSKIDILFATTAFGMGINIPDIEAVVHLQIPHSIEEYYQHVGRGWRNKNKQKDCNCLALWSEINFKRRGSSIKSEYFKIEDLVRAFKLLFGRVNEIGQIVSKEKEEYLKSSDNLQLVRYKLEERGLLETIGEINGSPMKIEFYKKTELWEKILENLDGFDDFLYASKVSGVNLKEIIEHLYKQEFEGNIKHLPAIRRDLFFKVNVKDIATQAGEEMIKDINAFVDRRLVDLQELEKLFKSSSPEKIIQEALC